ncbi:MAG: response regulator [Bacteroidia bacterium]
MNDLNQYNCVLLVDDDDTSLYLSAMTISRNSFAKHTHSMTSADMALNFIDENCEEKEVFKPIFCPDLIFLDINMPGMDGFDFLNEYNKLSDQIKSKIKVFMLTSSDNSRDREKADMQGVAGYIIKPLTNDKLKSLIQVA